MNAAQSSIDRLVDTVDYLRVQVGADVTTDPSDQRDWVPCTIPAGDPDALSALVQATKQGRGTDRDDVAMSLFVQGYAFRIASLSIGCWFLDGVILDIAPEHSAIALGRHRPNAVRLDQARIIDTDASVATLHEHLVDGHLAGVVDVAHRACRVGEALLWSNVGAGCASSFGALMDPLPDQRSAVRDQVEAFFEAARPELSASGQVARVGRWWAWERNACCLWYKTESGFQCEDCSLWSPEERQARYDRVLTETAAPTENGAET